MIRFTYFMQAFSLLLMVVATILGFIAAIHERTGYVLFESVIFVINLGLFYFQYRIRQKLRGVYRCIKPIQYPSSS
jgi:hypothetical protein